MPVYKCSNGKYRIGDGPCMYTSKDSAERAYRAYLAQESKRCGFLVDAIEHSVSGALVSRDGQYSYVSDPGVIDGELVGGPVVLLQDDVDRIISTAMQGTVESLRKTARKKAALSGRHVLLAETVKAKGDSAVVVARYLYEPHNRETLIQEASEALPDVMRTMSDSVCKELDPLDPRYFDRVAASLSSYMARDFKALSKPHFDKWVNDLIRTNWTDATDAELQLVTRRLNATLRDLGGKHWLDIRGQVYRKTETLGHAVKRATVKRYDLSISPNLALKDVQAIRQVAASHAHYVTDQMGNIAVEASRQAKLIVRNGLSKGLGSREIGEQLFNALGPGLQGRTRNYFDVAASAILNRSQSYSKVVTFSEAGVERCIWDSVLDEVTTRTCFVAGTLISTINGPVPIEDIRPGSMVLTGSGAYRPVKTTSVRLASSWTTLRFESFRPLTATDEHPIMMCNGWKESRHVQVGNEVVVQALRQRIYKDGKGPETLQSRMQGGIQTRPEELQARTHVHAVREIIPWPIQDDQILQQIVRKQGKGKARHLDNHVLQAVWEDIQGAHHIPAERPIPVLQHIVSAESEVARSRPCGIDASMRGVWQKIQDIIHGLSVWQDATPLLARMCIPKVNQDVCMVRSGIRDKQSKGTRVDVLFDAVLSKRQSSFAPRDVGRNDTKRIRNRIHRRVHYQAVFSGFRMPKANDSDRSGWGLLAHSQTEGTRRGIEGRGNNSARTIADTYSWQEFRSGRREGSVAQYLEGNTRRERVTAIDRRRLYRPIKAYNLEIDGDPTYFANGILVHNCRFCADKVFSVRAILGAYARTAELSNPKDVKYTQPWMRERKIKGGEFDGLVGLFLPQADGPDRLVAAELESAMGTVDGRGKWHPAMDIETLEDMGFSAPPGHGGCRSTLAPDTIPPKTRTRRIAVPSPAAQVPTVDPMGAKGPVARATANRGLAYYDGLRTQQAADAVASGRVPQAVSKYDEVIDWSEREGTAPVFSRPNGLELESGPAANRVVGILLAASVPAAAAIREVRLSGDITPEQAASKTDYREVIGVLTISREAARDTSEAGKYLTGKQLAYALELERRRAKRKDKSITKEDRQAARLMDLDRGVGTLFDATALENIK